MLGLLAVVLVAAIVWGGRWWWRATHPEIPEDTPEGWVPAVVTVDGRYGELDEPFGVAVADVNRDGRSDIVITTVNSRARPYESKLVVLLGDGFGGAAGSPLPVGPGAYQLAVGDVDEDGKPDIVTSSFESDSISVLLGR